MDTETAMSRLNVIPDYDPGGGPGDCVHTFRTRGGMILGAHWALEDAQAAMEKHGVFEVPGFAGHTIAVVDDTGPVLFETKQADNA